jgi:hypothetical protein
MAMLAGGFELNSHSAYSITPNSGAYVHLRDLGFVHDVSSLDTALVNASELTGPGIDQNAQLLAGIGRVAEAIMPL